MGALGAAAKLLGALGAAARLLGTAAELPGCHEFFFALGLQGFSDRL